MSDRTRENILRGIYTWLNSFPQVGGITKLIDSGISVDTSQYADLDVIDSVIALPKSVRKKAGSGVIQSLVVVDSDNQAADLDIYFFDDTFTTAADNAAWSPSYADMQKLIGVVNMRTYSTINSIAYSVVKNIGLSFDVASNSESLYMLAVSRGTPTYTAAGNLTIKVGILQD